MSDETYPITFGESTPKDQFGVYGDGSLLMKELGWMPKIELNLGLKIMADWVKGLSPTLLPRL
jgi:hypothetical protein